MIHRNCKPIPLIIVALVVLAIPRAFADAAQPLVVPASNAYFQPTPFPEGSSISENDGISGWSDKAQRIVWRGFLKAPGDLKISALLKIDRGQTSKLALHVGRERHLAQINGSGAEQRYDFGSYRIGKIGPVAIELEGLTRTGNDFARVFSISLSGSASQNAHFSAAKQRNAASVHLFYQTPQNAPIVAFYNEASASADPIWTYYCACGFSRGYFGIQVISKTERRIIFSVWDSGGEPVSRSKVSDENRVKAIASGPGVVVSDFGNEGTGAHSHLVYPWITGKTYRFLVTVKPQGAGALYSGYFYFPETKKWGLIASFFAPKDDGYLRGLYSFDEDFIDGNGYEKRYASFGPQWILTTDGKWTEIDKATFSFTDNGKTDRLDRSGGAVGDRFFLSTGGFETEETQKYGDLLVRQPSKTGPPDIDALLPSK